MDIHNCRHIRNWLAIMDIHLLFMDIHNWIMDIHKGIMHIHNDSKLWISMIDIMDIHKWIMKISCVPTRLTCLVRYVVYSIKCAYGFNSFWPNDVLWRHRSGSTLVEVVTCCLTPPNHYPNQSWRITKMFCVIPYQQFHKYIAHELLKSLSHHPGANELMCSVLVGL